MTAAIFAAEDKHRGIPGLELTPPERIVAQFWPSFVKTGLPAGGTDTPAYAVVNRGRWIVRCPWCPSAQNASRTDRRFFCVECENHGGGWATVIWPDDADQIELLLGRRPDLATRNWEIGETVDFVQDDNDRHGVR